jgi:hypothetical protein
MCKAKKLSNKMLDICNEIEIEAENLSKELSKYDLMEQDVLHMIESENFNAAEGYCLAKKLQDIRINRRNIKNEVQPIQTLVIFIKSNKSKIENVRDNVNLQFHNLSTKNDYHPRILKEVV